MEKIWKVRESISPCSKYGERRKVNLRTPTIYARSITKFRNLSTLPNSVNLFYKWISFYRRGSTSPCLETTPGEGRGTEWGRHFRYTWPRRRLCTLFGTSQSWFAFRFESTAVVVPLVNASRIVPTLIPSPPSHTRARNFIFFFRPKFSPNILKRSSFYLFRDSAKLTCKLRVLPSLSLLFHLWWKLSTVLFQNRRYFWILNF